ncbi:MAG: hypothetical protein ABFS12_17340, partial [Bacteroidota bacterium]
MTPKNIFIVGAGSFGRELESWISLDKKFHKDWEIKGYIDDNQNALADVPSDYSIIGNTDYCFNNEDYVVFAIADYNHRERIYNKLKGRVKFESYIDSSAIVGKYTVIGEGSVICPHTIISTNVKLGKCTVVNSFSQIGHDSFIDDFCSIMSNVDIGDHCIIGRSVFFNTKSSVLPGKEITSGTFIDVGSVVYG